jgi:hypothetical protein
MDSNSQRLRTLSVLASPSDLSRFDEDSLWRQICEVLTPMEVRGSLSCERLEPATLNALRSRLASAPWNVLHFVVHGQERVAARYGTIALKSSDGRAGNITAQALSALLASSMSLTLVVIQSACEGPLCFNTVADELIAHGIPAVLIAPRFPEQLQSVFLSRLYGGLLEGLSGGQLAGHITTARLLDASGLSMIRVVSCDPERQLFAPAPASLASAPPPVPREPPVVIPPWQETLRMKRAAKTFDVFLCHNSADKPMVRRIGQQLKEAGILPWIDVEELPPGKPWQPLLEEQITNIRSAAVCFGAAGIGPWQEMEMRGFLSAFVKRGAPVIPVLLPDAPSAPKLPVFLDQMTWVDFRSLDSDPLTRLIWGITGERPES